MKYQIYLQKDVSAMINAIAEGLNKKPSTLIKEMLESNFRNAYKDTLKATNIEDFLHCKGVNDGLKKKGK